MTLKPITVLYFSVAMLKSVYEVGSRIRCGCHLQFVILTLILREKVLLLILLLLLSDHDTSQLEIFASAVVVVVADVAVDAALLLERSRKIDPQKGVNLLFVRRLRLLWGKEVGLCGAIAPFVPRRCFCR